MIGINLAELSYPIFRLGVNKPEQQDGIVYYYHYKESDNGNIISLQVVDDKSVPGSNLSLRRLHLAQEECTLFKIRNAIYFLGDLIKIATPKTWFIDSTGRVFNYVKTTKAKLKLYPISQVIPINTGGAIIEVKGLLTRFKSLYMPESEFMYAGILQWGKSLVLYGFYDQYYEDSWRKV
jgi:hypothetical protein